MSLHESLLDLSLSTRKRLYCGIQYQILYPSILKALCPVMTYVISSKTDTFVADGTYLNRLEVYGVCTVPLRLNMHFAHQVAGLEVHHPPGVNYRWVRVIVGRGDLRPVHCQIGN